MSSLYEIHGKSLKTLISEEQLQTRIAELGAQITKDYEGKELVVIGVLRGCYLFTGTLLRASPWEFESATELKSL